MMFILLLRFKLLLLFMGLSFCNAVKFVHDEKNEDRLWLHRCNSVEKIKEFESEYPNFECDVIFRSENYFDVTHDYDKSNGVVLEDDFKELKGNDRRMWIDLKNLDENNCADALQEMERLVCTYNIARERLIIETRQWKALRDFTLKGYYTSCYIDIKAPGKMTEEERSQCLDSLRKVADSGYVRALSFYAAYYNFLDKNLMRPIDFLTWEHRRKKEFLPLFPRSRRMILDPQVKVILVKDKGHYHK